MSAALVTAIAAGVDALIQLGKLAAAHRQEAIDVLVRNMKPTPSSAEVDDYDAAKARLNATRPRRRVVSPPPMPPQSRSAPVSLRPEDVQDDDDDGG